MVRDLAHVVKREKVQMGVFITLAEPTKPMHTEAVKETFLRDVIRQAFTASNRNRRATANDKQPTSRSFIHPGSRKQHARRAQRTGCFAVLIPNRTSGDKESTSVSGF